MIDIDEAYAILRAVIRPLSSDVVPLHEALFRTLVQAVTTDIDDPPFDRAVMDGYAVRAVDVARVPVTLRVVGAVAAGQQPTRALQAGEAVQINTGAPLPAGADAVVRVEDTELVGTAEGDTASSADETDGLSGGAGARDGRGGIAVRIRTSASAGTFVTPRGTNVRAGGAVLPAGMRLTPPAVGAAAAAGAVTVTVHRRPHVAVLATGSELVGIDAVPEGAQIRNSNAALLLALIETAHAEGTALGIATDDQASLREVIREGLMHDVLCLTGGISMGALDLVPDILAELGCTFHIRKMAIKPGRPVIFATAADGTLIFALPGNPASAFVGFELLVRPALAALEGRAEERPRLMAARLTGRLAATKNRRTYLPATAHVDQNGAWSVEPTAWHGSGDVFGLARADALIMRAPNAPAAAPGELVSFHLLAND